MNRRYLAMTASVLLAVGGVAGCKGPTVPNCQRYDALTLTSENNFSARLDWNRNLSLDLPSERIEVALTAIRPIRGPIELVHLVGDTEADHWMLHVPDFNNSPTSLCSISTSAAMPNCGAVLTNLPVAPGGYYYLRGGDNTVLEAGLAFYLCD